MAPAFLVFAAATLLELTLWISGVWTVRKPLAWFLCVVLAVSGLLMVIIHPIFATFLLIFVTAYRIVNLLRVVKDRAEEKYLHRKVVNTSAYLICAQVIITAMWLLTQYYNLTSAHFWTLFSVLQLAGILIVVASTERHLRTTVPPNDVPSRSDKDLPTLTVAIPARNETDDLERCLESLIQSDYPKLEILVLDDCSQNARTPEIIRSYAHAGVRFLAGKDTAENWLAKNQAYQQLLDEANGEVILFAGVDSRYEPQSLRRLVSAMQHKNKTMLSIIPKNVVLPAAQQDESILLQPARYAWELSLPRKMFNRPPVLSTCWMIDKKTLQSAGGFAAVSRSIVPESYFARVSAVHDGYSFMQSDEYIGITSSKAAPDQFSTALRTRYPQLHRRPELVFALTLSEAFGLILPFLFLAAHLVDNWRSVGTVLSTVTCVLILYFYGRIVALTYRKFLLRGFFASPLAAMMDILVLNYSMAKYEFGEVIWKGRNVCIPVMRVTDRLPRV